MVGMDLRRRVRIPRLGHCPYRQALAADRRRQQPKIRAWPAKLVLEPGRYRITAYLRGLDIGTGVWNQTTEFMFAGQYMP